MKRAFISGGAGFIGSNLAERLLADEVEVVVYDNFSTGRREFLTGCLSDPRFTLIEGDTLDLEALKLATSGCDTVFHLAANADVRYGLDNPMRDLEQNTVATSNVLEAMRLSGVKNIVFSSTGSVYGEPELFPTPEHCPFPIQTSLYGASKVACEGLISAYSVGYNLSAAIFRFVSVLGERYTHGHVWDFYESLRKDPGRLPILGNGKQEKSYLYVGDCIEGLILAAGKIENTGLAEVFNIGNDETLTVNQSIAIICEELGVTPDLEYTGGERGWIGDSPLIQLDCSKLRALGWQPNLSNHDAVRATLTWFNDNAWIFEGASVR